VFVHIPAVNRRRAVRCGFRFAGDTGDALPTGRRLVGKSLPSVVVDKEDQTRPEIGTRWKIASKFGDFCPSIRSAEMDNPDRFIALIDELAALGHELPHVEFKVDNWEPDRIGTLVSRPFRILPASPMSPAGSSYGALATTIMRLLARVSSRRRKRRTGSLMSYGSQKKSVRVFTVSFAR
jgi:hypothetical protein